MGGGNMKTVLSGREAVVIIMCVDREENERCVVAPGVL